MSGWWNFKHVLFSALKIEEDEPILTSIFQMGWNHQPAVCFGYIGNDTGSPSTGNCWKEQMFLFQVAFEQ